MKTSVLKDNHTISVHVIDPKDGNQDDSDLDLDDGIEKGEFEKPEKEHKDGKLP